MSQPNQEITFPTQDQVNAFAAQYVLESSPTSEGSDGQRTYIFTRDVFCTHIFTRDVIPGTESKLYFQAIIRSQGSAGFSVLAGLYNRERVLVKCRKAQSTDFESAMLLAWAGIERLILRYSGYFHPTTYAKRVVLAHMLGNKQVRQFYDGTYKNGYLKKELPDLDYEANELDWICECATKDQADGKVFVCFPELW